MRTNIELDDALIAEAMRLGGHPTKRAAVEAGLRLLVQLARQAEAVEALRGSVPDWDDGLGWYGPPGDKDTAARPEDAEQPTRPGPADRHRAA